LARLAASDSRLLIPRRALAAPVLLSLAILASITCNGCTAIGFGIGAVIDETSGKGSPSRLVGVRTGVEITMWLTDARKLSGVYRGNRAPNGEAATLVQPVFRDAIPSAALHESAVILLETREGVQEVPVSSIWRVSVPVARGKVTGALIGLGLDAIVVLAAFAATGSASGAGFGGY
jgi:hypothetical protein